MFSREKQISSSHSHVAFSSDLKFAHFPFTQLLTNLILSACKECDSCFPIPLIKYASMLLTVITLISSYLSLLSWSL